MSDQVKSGDTTVRIKDPVLLTAEDLCEKLGKACSRIAIAGAVRRRDHRPTCIDLVAVAKIEPASDGCPAHNFLWAVLDYFYADGGYLKRGDLMRSCQVLLKNGAERPPWIPVNIYLATEETWGSKMVLQTGPEAFWFWMLSRLKLHGYISVDGRICKVLDGSFVPVPEEADLFALSQTLYKEPWQRCASERLGRSW